MKTASCRLGKTPDHGQKDALRWALGSLASLLKAHRLEVPAQEQVVVVNGIVNDMIMKRLAKNKGVLWFVSTSRAMTMRLNVLQPKPTVNIFGFSANALWQADQFKKDFDQVFPAVAGILANQGEKTCLLVDHSSNAGLAQLLSDHRCQTQHGGWTIPVDLPTKRLPLFQNPRPKYEMPAPALPSLRKSEFLFPELA